MFQKTRDSARRCGARFRRKRSALPMSGVPDMDVSVDDAGQNRHSFGVDDLRTLRQKSVDADGGDFTVFNGDAPLKQFSLAVDLRVILHLAAEHVGDRDHDPERGRGEPTGLDLAQRLRRDSGGPGHIVEPPITVLSGELGVGLDVAKGPTGP